MALLAYSCIAPNPETSLAPDEKDIYLTNFDPSGNFSNYKTYTISDSVSYSTNQDTTIKKMLGSIDQLTVSEIKNAMQGKGYTLVAKDQSPDVAITVDRVSITSIGTGITYPYGYGGYGYGYGYGSYYGSPAYVYNYEITNDALILQMLDLKDQSKPGFLKVVWQGEILGDFSPNQSVTLETRFTNGIRNLFAQSKYLQK